VTLVGNSGVLALSVRLETPRAWHAGGRWLAQQMTSKPHLGEGFLVYRQRSVRGCGVAIVFSRVLKDFSVEVQPTSR